MHRYIFNLEQKFENVDLTHLRLLTICKIGPENQKRLKKRGNDIFQNILHNIFLNRSGFVVDLNNPSSTEKNQLIFGLK